MTPSANPGDRFGRWTVIGQCGKRRKLLVFLCRCDCGKEKEVLGIYLGKRSNSCGCLQKDVVSETSKEPRGRIVGNRYGQIIVISQLAEGFECLCECGLISPISVGSISAGGRHSCGVCAVRTCPGGSRRSSEFGIWEKMHSRCEDKENVAYKHYGASGVTVCERWRDFREFYLDVGKRPSPKHSIDRHPNPGGNYEPDNVRWATSTEQARNKKTTKLISYSGKQMCLKEWCEVLGLSYERVRSRMRLGWSVENAFSVAKCNRWNSPQD
jgi:hypothetical protein